MKNVIMTVMSTIFSLNIINAQEIISQKINENQKVSMFITLPIDVEKQDSFKEIMINNVLESRKEKGNISFDAFTDLETNNFFVFERWENQDILNKHFETTHLNNVKKTISNSLRKNEQREKMNLIELSEFSPAKKINNIKGSRNVFIIYYVKPKAYNKFIASLLEVVPYARKAKGNIQFDVFRDSENPYKLLLVERWEDMETHENHRIQPYNKSFMDLRAESLEVPAVKSRRLLEDISND